eukprot:722669_1
MQSLPSALIGNLASYLKFYDYTSFQTANKTIYTECNTPNTLRHLDLTKINDYSGINDQSEGFQCAPITNLLATRPFLEFVGMGCGSYDSFSNICNAIERGLCNRKYKNKKIRLDLFLNVVVDMTKYKNILFMIVRIKNQLRALDVGNWMLCFCAKLDNTKLIRKECIEFEQTHSDVTMHHEAGKSSITIIISNAGCTFNGTREPFLWDNL